MSAFSRGPPRVGGQTYGGRGAGRMAGPCFEPLPAKPLSAASNSPCYHFGRARPAGGTANAPRGGRADERGEGTSQPAASVRARRAPSELRRTCGQPGGPESAPESSERSGRPRQRPQVPRKEGRQDPRRPLGPLSGQEHPGSRPAKRPISSAPRRNRGDLREKARRFCVLIHARYVRRNLSRHNPW